MRAPSTKRRGCFFSSATSAWRLINGNERETFAIHRERGVRRALAASGMTLGERHIRSVAMTEENGYRAACRLLEEAEPPDGDRLF
ncbi:hypothetical protein ACVOMV_08925 [Mesorhizobium atlanticum]